jgi:hypothetical protein
MILDSFPCKTIAVSPPAEYEHRPRLFRALEQALPVRFVGRQVDDYRDVDAVILLAKAGVSEPMPAGLPSFVATGTDARESEGTVDIGSSTLIDASLRGRSLSDRRAGGIQGLSPEGAPVVAACGNEVLWTISEAVDRVALAPHELGTTDSLRDALVPGRWLSLLPLVHFLRGVTNEVDWNRPSTRAAFIIDDPNLHWWSYGLVDFRQIAVEADNEGFHVAIATIPLDAWLVHPGVAAFFRDRRKFLSLLLHGNDHTREELKQRRSDQEASALLVQALRRVKALEQRSHLNLSRLMVAPFNLCSDQMMRAMMLTGFEGLCHAFALPRSRDRPLAGWEPAELVAGGLPVFPRIRIRNPRDDLVLRSFLGQPLIVYAHNEDFVDGLDILVETAAFINREPAVRWGSAESLARSSYVTRREGTLLHVRLFARSIQLVLDEDVEQIVIELPRTHGEPDRERATLTIGDCNSSSPFIGTRSTPLAARGPGTAEISLKRVDAVDPCRVASPPRRVRPFVRRAATESRDRLLPVSAKLRRTLGRRGRPAS